jgi:hypothetical protein
MRWGAAVIVGLSLLLAACGPGASDGAAPERKAPAKADRPVSEIDAAFAAAFGSPPPAVRVVERQGWGETTLRYRPARLIPMEGVTVLVSEAQTDGCHGCYGALAVHYLRKQEGGWRRLGGWPEILDGSSFGAPPTWTIRTDLFPSPAIESMGGGTWQGCTIVKSDFVELTPDRPVVRAQGVLTAFDYQPDEAEPASIEGKARPDAPGRSFAVDYQGAGGLTVVYRRNGDAYLPVGPQQELPEC